MLNAEQGLFCSKPCVRLISVTLGQSKRAPEVLDVKDQRAYQRSFGAAQVILAADRGKARLSRLHQSGSAKAFLPNRGSDEIVFLNTSGGLTGGDYLRFALSLGTGLSFTATTQTAERAYDGNGSAARVKIDLTIGANAHLDWLPQETLLYQNSGLCRDVHVQLEAGASVLLCEPVVLGRHAMGERPDRLNLQDRRHVTCQGRIVWAESLFVDPAALARQNQLAILGEARCFATIALIGPGAASRASALQPLLEFAGCETALSAWDGRLILRLRARENWPFRQHISRILTHLRGRPMPRVWQLNGDIA